MGEPVLPHARRRADGATVAAVYVATLMVVPAKLIFRGLPLSLTPATVIALGAAVCWACAHFTNSLGMAKGPNPVRTALYVYGVAFLATYLAATFGYLPADEVKLADHSLVLAVSLLGMALLVCDGIRGRDRLDLVLKTVAVASAVVSFVAALQFVLDLDVTQYLVLPGMRFSSDFDGFVFERADFRRVAGTTGNPIEFGVLCATTLPLALHYGFRAKARGTGAWRWWFVAAMIGAGLMFSVSRSAVLGIASAGAILVLGWPARRRISAVLVSGGFLLLVKIAFPGLIGTLVGLFTNFSTDDSVLYRTHDYPVAAAEIAKNPLLGRGVGTFYAPKHLVFDNQYLLTLVEGGVIGLLALVGLFAAAAGAALAIIVRRRHHPDRDLALTLLACTVVPAVGSVTFDLLSFHTVEGVFFVILAALGCLLRIARAEGAAAPPAGRAPAPAAATTSRAG